MDSVRLTWDAENDTYVLHVPGQTDMVLTIGDLMDVKARVDATIAETLA
jgi:hypothetical protein